LYYQQGSEVIINNDIRLFPSFEILSRVCHSLCLTDSERRANQVEYVHDRWHDDAHGTITELATSDRQAAGKQFTRHEASVRVFPFRAVKVQIQSAHGSSTPPEESDVSGGKNRNLSR
jgi:hypothetical protein